MPTTPHPAPDHEPYAYVVTQDDEPRSVHAEHCDALAARDANPMHDPEGQPVGVVPVYTRPAPQSVDSFAIGEPACFMVTDDRHQGRPGIDPMMGANYYRTREHADDYADGREFLRITPLYAEVAPAQSAAALRALLDYVQPSEEADAKREGAPPEHIVHAIRELRAMLDGAPGSH